MFDFSWSELALIAVVALVVIGPKDLPRVMRTAGMWMRKARSVAREFQGSIDQMVREAELEDVRETVQQATRFNIKDEFERHIDPTGELRDGLSDPTRPTQVAELPKPASAETAPPSAPAPDAAHEATRAEPAPPVEGGGR
jgi:sec-independent protein translocase protein TatB